MKTEKWLDSSPGSVRVSGYRDQAPSAEGGVLLKEN